MPLIEVNMILDCEEEIKQVGFYTPLEYCILNREDLKKGILDEIHKKDFLLNECNHASAMALHEGYVVASFTMKNKRDWIEDCLTIN
jgi:hypothetical protein